MLCKRCYYVISVQLYFLTITFLKKEILSFIQMDRFDEFIETKLDKTDFSVQGQLAVAKLGLLHAKVEPHFLCNTRGSVKYLIKSDPLRAEEMLDNLILYLRHSLPRIEGSLSTMSEELARAR